jgi:hypothetical protein
VYSVPAYAAVDVKDENPYAERYWNSLTEGMELTSAEWRAPELLAWLFNESPVRDEVVIDDRWGKETRHHHGGYFTTEYTPGMTETDRPWEENRSRGK